MTPGQSLSDVATCILDGLSAVFKRERFDTFLVQGDTTTAFAGILAAYYEKILVAHVETGLQSGGIYAPWPEEANRRTIGVLHFAPNNAACDKSLERR